MVVYRNWSYEKDGTTPINASPSSNTFKIDILDLEVSAGPGVINREFVEILRSVGIRRTMPDTCLMVERLKISAS